jgi:hypothetical protein
VHRPFQAIAEFNESNTRVAEIMARSLARCEATDGSQRNQGHARAKAGLARVLQQPCPVTDPFGVQGRRLLKRLQVPEPWRGNITASIELIDDLVFGRSLRRESCRSRVGLPAERSG